ncbi:hypothetical protein [Bradyrhizobium sp. SRS-191]|uniref:hypothetical protein n=1 Tax=Bradyrhizobium sp. SRS-191 TaxID=2962606 RepID=UPI00211E04D2|nr:hypothetical protein [Bradyrhizobium sp. SRS-191]
MSGAHANGQALDEHGGQLLEIRRIAAIAIVPFGDPAIGLTISDGDCLSASIEAFVAMEAAKSPLARVWRYDNLGDGRFADE